MLEEICTTAGHSFISLLLYIPVFLFGYFAVLHYNILKFSLDNYNPLFSLILKLRDLDD